MFKHYTTVIKKYADFSGRASIAEFWWFTLVNIIISMILYSIAFITPLNTLATDLTLIPIIVYFLYALFTFLPNLAVTVRRLHDTGKSGWWIFIVLIPLIGPIWHFINMILDGKPENNKYGPNPKLQNNNTGNSEHNPNLQ